MNIIGFLTQKTVLGIAVLLILGAGVIGGVYVTQKPTQLQPKASELMQPAPTEPFACDRKHQYFVGDKVGRCNQPPNAQGCYKTAYATYTDGTLDSNGDGVADPNDPEDQPMCDASNCSTEYNQCPSGQGGNPTATPAPTATIPTGQITRFDPEGNAVWNGTAWSSITVYFTVKDTASYRLMWTDQICNKSTCSKDGWNGISANGPLESPYTWVNPSNLIKPDTTITIGLINEDGTILDAKSKAFPAVAAPTAVPTVTTGPTATVAPTTAPTVTTTITPTVSPTVSPTAAEKIYYRIAMGNTPNDAKNRLDSATFTNNEYIQGAASGVMRIDQPMGEVIPGDVRVFAVQFRRGETLSGVTTKDIKYIGGAPVVNNLECRQQSSGPGTLINITGSNFGTTKGTLKVKGKNETTSISNWGETFITLNLSDLLSGENEVEVTSSGGGVVKRSCTMDITTVQFVVKNICNIPLATENVDVKIYANVPSATAPEPLINQKIKTARDGTTSGFTPKLEKAKRYSAVIKAPKMIARNIPFETSGGTTVVEVTLPYGDIAPLGGGNGNINSEDYSELVREWNLTSNVAKEADLNKDGRVNSFDYTCLIRNGNFNKSDEVFTPPTAATPTPTIATTTTPAPTTGTTSTPTPTVGTTQTTITLSADITNPASGIQISYTGILRDASGNAIPGKVIKLIDAATSRVYEDSIPAGDNNSHDTDSSGAYLIKKTYSSSNPRTFYARFDGDSTYAVSQSQQITITPSN